MRCPFCHHEESSVRDSRTVNDYSSIRRRRICHQCGSRFTTLEHVQIREILVVKKNGQRAPFSRDKLTRSIIRAIHKSSLNLDQVDRVVSSIARQLETSGDAEIQTQQIGEKVMEALRHVDSVAYVRFASIYLHFDSIHAFSEIIQNVVGEEETEDSFPTE